MPFFKFDDLYPPCTANVYRVGHPHPTLKSSRWKKEKGGFLLIRVYSRYEWSV